MDTTKHPSINFHSHKHKQILDIKLTFMFKCLVLILLASSLLWCVDFIQILYFATCYIAIAIVLHLYITNVVSAQKEKKPLLMINLKRVAAVEETIKTIRVKILWTICTHNFYLLKTKHIRQFNVF